MKIAINLALQLNKKYSEMAVDLEDKSAAFFIATRKENCKGDWKTNQIFS